MNVAQLASLILTFFAVGFIILFLYRFYAQLKVKWGEPVGYINFLLISPDRVIPIEGPTFKMILDEGAFKEYLFEKILQSIENLPEREKLEALKAFEKKLESDLPIEALIVGDGEALLINYSPYSILNTVKVNPEVKVDYPYQLKQCYCIAYTQGRESFQLEFKAPNFLKIIGLKKGEATPCYFIYPIDFGSMKVIELRDEDRSNILEWVNMARKFTEFHELRHRLELLEAELKAEKEAKEEAIKSYTDKIVKLESALRVAREATKEGGIISKSELALQLIMMVLAPAFILWFIGSLIPQVRTDVFMALGMILGIALFIFRIGRRSMAIE